MLIDCNCNGDEQLEYKSVSEALADNRIVSVTRLEDGHYEVREMCDEWASARLTAEQLRAWGQELIDMANAKCSHGGTPLADTTGSQEDRT